MVNQSIAALAANDLDALEIDHAHQPNDDEQESEVPAKRKNGRNHFNDTFANISIVSSMSHTREGMQFQARAIAGDTQIKVKRQYPTGEVTIYKPAMSGQELMTPPISQYNQTFARRKNSNALEENR